MTLPSRIIYPNWLVDSKYIEKEEKKWKLYTNLEKSMYSEGCKNPVFVRWGDCPSDWFNFMHQMVQSGDLWEFPKEKSECISGISTGTARILVARRHDWWLPCIVMDYLDKFPSLPEIETYDELKQYFGDHEPYDFDFQDYDVTYQCKNWHEGYLKKSYDHIEAPKYSIPIE